MVTTYILDSGLTSSSCKDSFANSGLGSEQPVLGAFKSHHEREESTSPILNLNEQGHGSDIRRHTARRSAMIHSLASNSTHISMCLCGCVGGALSYKHPFLKPLLVTQQSVPKVTLSCCLISSSPWRAPHPSGHRDAEGKLSFPGICSALWSSGSACPISWKLN